MSSGYSAISATIVRLEEQSASSDEEDRSVSITTASVLGYRCADRCSCDMTLVVDTDGNFWSKACLTDGGPLSRQLWSTSDEILQPAEDVRQYVQYETYHTHTVEVMSCYESLRAKVSERDVECISDMWSKWPQDRRQKFLLQLLPNIPKTSLPDFDATWKKLSGAFVEAHEGNPFLNQTRLAYLCPHLNLVDLSTESNIIEYLKSRASNHPQMFAYQDLEATRLGVVNDGLKRRYIMAPLTDCRMQLDEVRAAIDTAIEDYGIYLDLTPLIGKEGPEKEVDVIRANLWGVQPGVLTLESQILQLRFLDEFYEASMSVLNSPVPASSSTANETVKETAAKAMKKARKQEALHSSTLLSRRAYVSNPLPVFDDLLDLVQAQKLHAIERYRLCHQDPSYLRNALKQYLDNDERCRSTMSLGPLPIDGASRVRMLKAGSKALKQVMFDLTDEIALGTALQELLHALRVEVNEHSPSVIAGTYMGGSLPQKLFETWACAMKVIDLIRAAFAIRLHNPARLEINNKGPSALKDSKFIRSDLLSEVDHGLESGVASPLSREARIRSLFQHLGDERYLKGIGLPKIVDFLDRNVSSMLAEGRPGVNEWHQEAVYNLVIIAYVIGELDLWNQRYTYSRLSEQANDFEPQMRKNFEKYGLKSWWDCLPLHGLAYPYHVARNMAAMLHFKDDVVEFFLNDLNYPAEPRSKKDVKAKIRAETMQDKLWDAFGEHVNACHAQIKQDEEEEAATKGAEFMQRMGLAPEDPWAALGINTLSILRQDQNTDSLPFMRGSTPPKEQRGKSKAPQAESSRAALPDWIFNSRAPVFTTKNYDPPFESKKTKTVGEARQDPAPEPAPEPEPEPEIPKIALKRKHYITMMSIWKEEHVKQVKWTNFVKAMGKCGMQVRGTGGSKVKFTPVPGLAGPQPSVIIHNPHANGQTRLNSAFASQDTRAMSKAWG